MPSNSSNLAAIRWRLGNPDTDAPTSLVLLNLLIDQLLHHHAQLVNTRNHWSVESWSMTVSEGVEDYVIGASNFGRPFLVYTADDTDTYHTRREIPFSLMQDADQRYFGPQQTQSSAAHSAVEMVFYRREGIGWYARPVPIPGASGTYTVWYETNYTYGSLSDTPGLESFHHLLRVQTAIAALPHCAWRDIAVDKNAKAWELKTKALALSLTHDEQMFQKQFDIYRAQSSREAVSAKLGYGWEFEADYGEGGVGSMINGYGI